MSRNDLRGTSDFVRRLLNREWKRLRKKEGQANIDAMIDNWNDGDFDWLFVVFWVIVWDMILRDSQTICLSLSAENFSKLRTASLARDITIEEQLLRYIDKDYSKNGDSMEPHLDAKGEYIMDSFEARNS